MWLLKLKFQVETVLEFRHLKKQQPKTGSFEKIKLINIYTEFVRSHKDQ